MAERMSDAAVQAKTGRNWQEWFAILNAAGARTMTHQQIVALLSDQHGVEPWWQQAVTVGYEQEHGGRDKHQMSDGYQISVNKTVAVPLATLYRAWSDESVRGRWLPDAPLTVRSGQPEKTLNARWEEGRSNLQVRFYAKGEDRSQVSVQHNKLADAQVAARMKAYWVEALERLAKESGT